VSRLWYRFGAMNSGKSTSLLQVAYNYEERGQTVLIAKPSVDTKGDDTIVSRLGVTRKVDFVISPELNILTAISLIEKAYNLESKGKKIDCLIIDEAQFLTRVQVDQLFYIAVELNIPVLAYGIRSDFQSNAFTGSARLLEIAHSLEELKTICRCGKKAMFNGRKVDGRFILEGDQVAIDGDVEYESLCGKCYIEKVGRFSN
jgi:thymidine kinase